MVLHLCCLASLLMAVGVKAPAEVVRTGWLDRVVAYSKQKFIEDVQSVLPPIEFKVQLAKAPPGYVDSKEWDYDSVMRLLTLLRQSEQAKPVARALRRMMGKPDIVQNNTRRIFMSKQESYKFFPKLGSNVYYEDSYEQDMGPMPDLEGGNFMPGDYSSDAIVIISNPVESRLPSSHISVGMLKEILETRAMAARVMPTYEVPTIYWAPMNTTTDAVENVTGASQENATTTGGDAAAGGDDASSGNDSNGSNSSDPVPGVDDISSVAPDPNSGGSGVRRQIHHSKLQHNSKLEPNSKLRPNSKGHSDMKTIKRHLQGINPRRFKIFKTKRALARHATPPVLNKEKVNEVVRRTIEKQQRARARLRHAKHG